MISLSHKVIIFIILLLSIYGILNYNRKPTDSFYGGSDLQIITDAVTSAVTPQITGTTTTSPQITGTTTTSPKTTETIKYNDNIKMGEFDINNNTDNLNDFFAKNTLIGSNLYISPMNDSTFKLPKNNVNGKITSSFQPLIKLS